MSSIIVGGAKVALVKSGPGGMECEAFPSALGLVLAVINRGGLAGDGWEHIGFGCPSHKAALAVIECQIASTRKSIEALEASDAGTEGSGNG